MSVVCFRKLALFVTLFAVSESQPAKLPAPAPAPAVDCISRLMSLSTCLAFLISGSNATEPDRTCCDGLNTVLTTDAQNGVVCLCHAFNDRAGLLGVQVNVTKAMSLPNACYLTLPSAANCSSRSQLDVLPSSVVENPTAGTGANSDQAPDSSGCSSFAASVELLVRTAPIAVFFVY